MSRFDGMRGPPVEFYTLDVEIEEPIIGHLNGRAIPGTILDRAGRRYDYVGLARRFRGGRLDIRSLGPDEWMVLPGLIYRDVSPLRMLATALKRSRQPWWRRLRSRLAKHLHLKSRAEKRPSRPGAGLS